MDRLAANLSGILSTTSLLRGETLAGKRDVFTQVGVIRHPWLGLLLFVSRESSHQKVTMPQLYLKEVEPFLVAPKNGKQTEDGNNPHSSIGGQKVYSRHTTKRSTSLIVTDALLLCLEFFQVLAILQAMSLKWIWPETWIKSTSFLFFFNMDVWEFIKVSCGAFIGARLYDTPSATVSTQFYYILIGWAAFFMLLALIWAAIRVTLHVKQPAYLLVHNARLKRAMIIILQIVALPFGTSAFKVFHCTSTGEMSVDNSVECWSGLHWAYIVPVLVAVLVVMMVFPAWLVWHIRHEAMASADEHHQDFLKLKEVEYMSGLDVVWSVHGFHLFSSFRLRAIYYRPVMHVIKLLILILYAATFQSSSAQAISMLVLLLLVALLTMVIRPFRLTVFNVIMVMGYFCLTGDALFGAVITQFDPTQVRSPWLVEPYSLAIMIAVNAVFLLGIVIFFLIYLLAYRFCCQGRCVLEPLWPVMTAYEYDVEGVETQKYLAAVLRGRAVIERCRRLPSMFAPVHEMSHQICVLNAYMRESELMHDGLHPTLWAVLDEMIDMHHRLEPKSLFGEMVQESIRKNAAHFMTLMPMFAQRLAQRDYDFMLVPPYKKRLLLKMYIIALWLDGSRRRKTHQELTQKVLISIWEESPEVVQVTDEREYREDLYPETIQGPETEALYMTGTLDLGRGLYDLEAVEEEEESLSTFLKRAPPTLVLKDEDFSLQDAQAGELTGADNPAFIPDDDKDTSEYHGHSNQQLTTTEVHDTSEAPPDVVVDLEALVKGDNHSEGEATVTFVDSHTGETNTDMPSEGELEQEDEEPDDGTTRRHNTSVSVISTKSASSAKSGASARSKTSVKSESAGKSGDVTAASAKSAKSQASTKGSRSKGGKTFKGKQAAKQ